MTVKQFFKSTSFKCIAVLLAIVLVCGVLLTICNSLFYVTDQERRDRAIAKIYGKAVEYEQLTVDEANKQIDEALIREVYKINDNGINYLIKSTGGGGFSGGTVTCWVVVEATATAVTGVGNVEIDSNEGQSYISKITKSFRMSFGEKYTDGKEYSPDDGFFSSGATKSSTAICNAVNGSVAYVKKAILGISGGGEEDVYADYEYNSMLAKDRSKTTVEIVDGQVKFTIATKSNGDSNSCSAEVIVDGEGKITSYAIKVNGANSGYENSVKSDIENFMIGKTKDDLLALIGTEDGKYNESAIGDELKTGATQANYLFVYMGLFATANYQKAAADSFVYTMNLAKDASKTTYEVLEDGQVKFTVTTKSNGEANSCSAEVIVDGEGKITSYAIKVNGANSGYENSVKSDIENFMIGKTEAELLALIGTTDGKYNESAIGDELKTGATQANYLFVYMGLYATANRDAAVLAGGNA